MHFFLFALFLLYSGCGPSSRSEASLKQAPDDNKSFVCFVYHRFGEDRYPSTNVSIETFKKHLQYLRSENFEVMALSDAISYMRGNTISKKIAVITIDDGYKSFKTGAMPLLQEFGYPATLFINTETVGSSSYLDWTELKELKTKSIEIGNHSHSHTYFVNKDENERYSFLKNDVEKAQKIIEEKLDIIPKAFAYPYGEFDQEMKTVIKGLGFAGAVAQNSGVMSSQADYLAIPRFPMARSFAAIESFKEKASMRAPNLQTKKPEINILTTKNPPELTLTFSNDDMDANRLQCFIQGSQCQLNILKKDPLTVSIQAKEKLQRRRTLYTITVPSNDGGWYWYSHLYINPNIKE